MSAYLPGMRLLELRNGGLSLELASDEINAVVARLQGTMGFARHQHATLDEFVSPGPLPCSVYLMNDWDDPCLIAGSRDAHPFLRMLAAKPDAGQAASPN